MTMQNQQSYSGSDHLDVMLLAKNYNKALLALMLHAAGKSIQPTMKVLDFGAGSGHFAHEFQKATGCPVLCVEPDRMLAQKITQRGLMAIDDLSGAEEKAFDFIYSLNVLEHIQHDEEILHQLKNKLKSGGKLFIFVPAFPLLFTAMDQKVGHVRRYGLEELKNKIQTAGFLIEQGAHYDVAGFFATLAQKTIEHFRGNDPSKNTGEISPRALQAFDRYCFPVNRVLDPVLGRWLGKNVFVVARG